MLFFKAGLAADEGLSTTLAPDDEQEFIVNVKWRLTDIDYPICLDYFILSYYDTLYNETGFTKTYTRFITT